MTDDLKVYSEVISPAADVAVALDRIFREILGRAEYYAEGSGLGFGYRIGPAGELRIVVDWQDKRSASRGHAV